MSNIENRFLVLDGDFKGHPFRGNGAVKVSRESGSAVGASKRAKRAERTGDAAAQKKAHKIAHHAHMAAAEEATTERSRKYHETMAKFHGGRAGVRLDSVALDGIDQDGYVGKVYRGSELIGRVDIAGDGKAMVFVGPSGDQRVTEMVLGERTPARYSDADTGDLIGMLLENLAGEQAAQSAPIELPYKFASATAQAMRLFSVAHGGGAPKNAYKTAVRVEESLPNGTVVNWDSVADLPDTGTRLDDVAGLFGADQGGGYVVGEVKTSDGKLVATVTIRGDGAAMFEPSDAYAKSVGGIDPDDDDEGWGSWIDYDMMENMLTELHDAAADMRPPTEQEEEAMAAQAERDRKAAEEKAAADAARQALADAAKAFGEGKKGFLGVVDNPGKVGASVSALMQRKPAGSFVFVVDRDWKASDAAGKAVFGVAMWSRQKLGRSGLSIDPNGKIGNVRLTILFDTPDQAYLAGTKALTSAGGVVPGAPREAPPPRYVITAERITGGMKNPGGFALTVNGERKEFVGEEPENLADRAAELASELSVSLNKALARLAVDEGWDKREASGTTKIQDPNIGREWDTQKGRRQIVGTFGDDMYEAKNMSTGGVLRIFKAKLEEQIAADQFAMTPEYAQQKEAEKAARDAQAARDAEDAAKGAALDAEIAKWTSDAGMSAMLAERARAALTKNRNADGRIATVGEIIREEVAAGAVVSEVRGEARLTAPSGSFLGEAQITKMGMDYARWLVAKSGSTGGTEPAALAGLRDIISGRHDSTPLPELLAKIEELITALGGAEDLTGEPAQVANDAITHWVKLDEKANG